MKAFFGVLSVLFGGLFICGLANFLNPSWNPQLYHGVQQVMILGGAGLVLFGLIWLAIPKPKRSQSTSQTATSTSATQPSTQQGSQSELAQLQAKGIYPARTIDEVEVVLYPEVKTFAQLSKAENEIQQGHLWAIVHDVGSAWEVWIEGVHHSPCGTEGEAHDLIERIKTGESPWTSFKYYTPPKK